MSSWPDQGRLDSEEQLDALKREYGDIIGCERPVFSKHPRMSLEARAAQFAPFAALSGYAEAIDKTTEEVAAEYDGTDGQS